MFLWVTFNFLTLVLWQFWRFYWDVQMHLTCQSQLNFIDEEVQFLGLCEPRLSFSRLPQLMSSSIRLADLSCLCFCFTSGLWPHSDLILVCAQPMHCFPLEEMGVWLRSDSVSFVLRWVLAFCQEGREELLSVSMCSHQLKQYFLHIKKENRSWRDKLVFVFLFWPMAHRVLVKYGSVYLRLRESVKLCVNFEILSCPWKLLIH